MKKHLKYAVPAVIIIAGIIFLMVYAYIGFYQQGLDTWLVGQTEADHYPDWEENVEITKLDRHILNKDHLFISKVYLLKGSTGSYQLRFRIAYSIPFMHGSLFQDTDWVKLADDEGNDYTGCLTVYASRIAGLNCVNATLVMDADTFSLLAGGKLTVSAICKDTDALPAENGYAGCEVEILIPEMERN